MPLPLVIDTDAGVDDALAILMLLASPEVDILAVTAVFGTGPVEQVARNVLATLTVASRTDIPVYAGAATGLLRAPRFSPYAHGSNGLGDVTLPEIQQAVAKISAIDYYIDELVQRTEPVTVLTLGPLTNLALALATRPSLRDVISGIVAMGGAFWVTGTHTPAADGNMLRDPEAAAMVIASGVPLTLIPRDVTTKVQLTSAELSGLARAGPVARFASQIIAFYSGFYQRNFGFDGIQVNDPTAAAYLLRPDLFTAPELYVDIERGASIADGKTFGDPERPIGRGHRAHVALDVDAPAVQNLVLSRLLADPLPGRSHGG